MCSVVILRRPDHAWPLVLAANRDEMADRPWRPPARHWPDRPEVVAGIDLLAEGTWLGLNDHGVVAGVLNRPRSLGPHPAYRSRGELPLEALDHADAAEAAKALTHIEASSYRTFNMVVCDNRDAFWLRSVGGGEGSPGSGQIEVMEVPPGLSMITDFDRNDPASPRIRTYLPQFEATAPPDPGTDEWSSWEALLASRIHHAEAGPQGAMNVVSETGFGTVSSSLIALPDVERIGVKALWRFAAGRPDEAPFEPVEL